MKVKDLGSRIVQMSYPGDACGLNRMDGESNEIVYGNFDISVEGE